MILLEKKSDRVHGRPATLNFSIRFRMSLDRCSRSIAWPTTFRSTYGTDESSSHSSHLFTTYTTYTSTIYIYTQTIHIIVQATCTSCHISLQLHRDPRIFSYPISSLKWNFRFEISREIHRSWTYSRLFVFFANASNYISPTVCECNAR